MCHLASMLSTVAQPSIGRRQNVTVRRAAYLLVRAFRVRLYADSTHVVQD